MKIVLKIPLSVPDIKTLRKPIIGQTIIPAGAHDVRYITNPWPGPNSDRYIALVGTNVGAGEQYLRSFASPELGDRQIVIED